MKTCLAAFAFAAAIVQPAAAITFPKLTTIYIGSGVLDNGAGADTGTGQHLLLLECEWSIGQRPCSHPE
jgi:hypothetical protein